MTAAPRARPGRRWGWLIALATFAGPLAPACHRDIHLLPLADSDGGAGAGGLGGVAGAAGTGIGGAAAGGAAGGGMACVGLGNPITLPTAAGATCAAALAARGHRFALCTCDTLTLDARLRTDAFDSTNAGVNDQVSAAVGVDGALQTSAELRAGGAIYVADATGVRASDHLQAGASFQSNGPLAMLSSNADLLADAYVAGDVSGQVQVSGTLHVPASATLGPQVQAKAVAMGAVTVASPCDCSAGFVDVTGAIAAAASHNDDAAAGFGADVLGKVSTSTSLDLPCGTFYLSSMQTTAPITLLVHGHALLAVAGDVKLSGGGLTVVLDPSAELDLLIAGWFTASGGGVIGAPTAPARFRIWVAGTESLVFDDQPTVAAVIHAPAAAVTAPSGLTVSGSLLVKSLSLGDDSLLHYDRAILSAGVSCGEPAAAVVP
jgi:hypothetical protein